MKVNLGELSAGEKLWLWRRRKGWTQDRAAKHLGVCFETYNRAEVGLGRKLFSEGVKLPDVREALTMPEMLRLARRRHGVKLLAIASDWGTSHVTFLAAEKSGAPDLAAFWRRRGFKFPQA